MTRLMEHLNDEVEGALTTQKIRGDLLSTELSLPTTAAFNVDTKSRKSNKAATRRHPELFCAFCEGRGHWAQDSKKVTSVTDRIEKLKHSSRCFLCINRGHSAKNCINEGKQFAQNARNRITTPSTQLKVYKIATQTPDFTHLQMPI
jgi:hypothetical protein